MRASRTLLRQGALALVVLFLAACGGSSNDTDPASASIPPTPSVVYPSSVPATAVVTLDGSGSTATGGRTLTYSWVLTTVPTGSAATLGSPTASKTSLTTDLVGNYVVTLTVSDGLKSQSVPITVGTTAYTPPTILSDLVVPVSGNVQLFLSADEGTSTIVWTVDGAVIGSGAVVGWDTTTVGNGNHVVAAQVQSPSAYVINVSSTFKVAQTTVSFTSEAISESAGVFTAIVGAQSANGIVRIDAALDGVAVGSLAAPNTCLDPTGVACAAAGLNNGYTFSGSVASGSHVVVVTATDGIGNSLQTQLRLNVTDVP
jgi:hypothetical protein